MNRRQAIPRSVKMAAYLSFAWAAIVLITTVVLAPLVAGVNLTLPLIVLAVGEAAIAVGLAAGVLQLRAMARNLLRIVAALGALGGIASLFHLQDMTPLAAGPSILLLAIALAVVILLSLPEADRAFAAASHAPPRSVG